MLLLSACRGPTPVHVRATFQPGVPLLGLEIAALPFDAEVLLDSLGRTAQAPRPGFPELEEQMRQYRRDDGRDDRTVEPEVTAAWLATRDSVARLSESLRRMDRRGPGYRGAYARFRELYGRFAARAAARESGLRKLYGSDRNLAQRASRAADELRTWERDAYHAFPQLAGARAAGRPAQRASTDSTGAVHFDLRSGHWWLTARIPDPDNPFEEWHWNVPVTVTAGLPFAVPLLRVNATARWRH